MSGSESNTSARDSVLADGHSVVDEEGDVDKKVKRRILNSRERVDKAERAIFVEAAVDPNVTLSFPEKVATWGVIVKQYVRNVEPLLRAETIDDASRFYHEIDLGQVTVRPPETDTRDWSLVQYSDLTDSEVKDILRLPLSATLPKPETTNIEGLKMVIELPQVISKQWRVQVEEGMEARYETVTASQPIPRETYTQAVRKTDQFLQEAGVGIEISPESVPDFGFEEVGHE